MSDIPRISERDPKFREPRTADEMLPARRAELAALPVPDCPNGHGPMVVRPLESQTYEQLYCGIWYDCAPGPHQCMSSVGYTSRELAHYHGRPYNDGSQWWKYHDGGWVPISKAEADEFWRRLAAWQDVRHQEMFGKPKRRRKRAA
jgi:hypothetical protein